MATYSLFCREEPRCTKGYVKRLAEQAGGSRTCSRDLAIVLYPGLRALFESDSRTDNFLLQEPSYQEQLKRVAWKDDMKSGVELLERLTGRPKEEGPGHHPCPDGARIG